MMKAVQRTATIAKRPNATGNDIGASSIPSRQSRFALPPFPVDILARLRGGGICIAGKPGTIPHVDSHSFDTLQSGFPGQFIWLILQGTDNGARKHGQ
jgi:hypothetical protein